MDRRGNMKALVVVALLIAVAGLTIAFAAMSKTLTINGTATMDTAVWDIHFKSASVTKKIGDAKEKEAPQITNGGADLVLKVSLRKPKDEIVYNAVIENAGDIDAEIESIEYPTLTDDQKKILEFEATYEDGTEISEKQELKSKEDVTVKIVIRYKDITDESLLAKEAYDIPLTFKINYVQKGVGSNMPGMGDGSGSSKSVLAYNTDFLESDDLMLEPIFNSPIGRGEIESITFSKEVVQRSSNTWDASASGDKSITGYYEDSDDNGLYEVYIESENDIYAPADCSWMFAFMPLKELNFNNFKTNEVKSMFAMFLAAEYLTTLDVSGFNTSNVTSMDMMFSALAVTTLDLSNFDTSNVTGMSSMFEGCGSLISVDLSSFNTNNVTDMAGMFSGCESLLSVDLRKFNTSNLIEIHHMFNDCSSLTSLDLSSFNTSNITNMEQMFSGCSSLLELKFNSADFSNIILKEGNGIFSGVANIKVYVKDEAAANFINLELQDSNATGQAVIQPLES